MSWRYRTDAGVDPGRTRPWRGWTLAALALGSLAAGCAATPPAEPGQPGRLQVAVSVPPQGYLVERIGGDRVAVEVMIPPGASESTYAPSPRQMVALSEARLYVLVGHPAFLFESEHIAPFLAERPEIRRVDMSQGMDLILDGDGAEGHAEPRGLFGEEGHSHEGGDPHVWVAPSTVRVAAANIERALAERDPGHASLYRKNLAAFLADVDALDREIRTRLAHEPRGRQEAGATDGAERSFFVYHPSWGYFAREYGLRQVAIEAGGREPSAARVIELVELARRERVQAIFVQRGFAWKSARVLADEIGARVVVVDPMGADWLGEMRRAARAFEEALSAGTLEENPRHG